ncbi:MAG: phosphoribosylglycinamide formyltransferase, partial [Firmicutes bacterium]|nr:phosphoribosylglycinamide formyltransferase [Bacillota bacterium]
MKNIAVFASGKGSNFLAINDAIQKGLLDANICLFVTDKVHSEGLKKAKELHINTFSFSAQNYNSKEGYE